MLSLFLLESRLKQLFWIKSCNNIYTQMHFVMKMSRLEAVFTLGHFEVYLIRIRDNSTMCCVQAHAKKKIQDCMAKQQNIMVKK
jgi:hypothetical protein